MILWLVTTEYPPFYGGGIATYCLHTANMMSQKGHEVTVFISDHSIDCPLQILNENLIRIVRFKPGEKDIYKYLGYAAALSYDISEIIEGFIKNEGNPDVIEFHDYLGISYFSIQKKKVYWKYLKEARILVTVHTPKFICDYYDQAPVYNITNYWTAEMERYCICAADTVISPSLYLLNELSKYIDLSDVDSHVVPNPFSVKSDNMDNLDIEKNDVIFFGRLQYLKGIDYILNKFSSLWDNGFQIPLKIIGSDTYFYLKNKMWTDYINQKFKKYVDENLIVFEGLIPTDKLYNRLKKAHVIIIPSCFENFPYSVIESMALGKIILVSDSGGQRELVENNKNGFVFSHDEPDELENKLKLILSLSDDRMQEISREAKITIEEICSYENVYTKKITVLEQLINKNKFSRQYPFIRKREKSLEKLKEHEKDSINKPYQEVKGLLSVIVPYYNMGEYVREALESIINTTYPDKEIIIVNDGSDELESLTVLYEVQEQYPVEIIHKKNGGLSSARNAGAEAARGEYIAFLDSDDMISSEYYEWAIKLLQHYDNVSFIGCWAQYFEGSEKIWPAWNPEPPYLLIHNLVNSSALVLRRRDFLLYGMNDPKMEYGMEDYESVVNMVKNGCMGIVIPKPLFQYRIRSNSMSSHFNNNNMAYLQRLISEKHSEIYKEYAPDIFNLLNHNGPGYFYGNPSKNYLPMGFVEVDVVTLDITGSSYEIPIELKNELTRLWKKPLFRKAIKLFFNMKLNKLFF